MLVMGWAIVLAGVTTGVWVFNAVPDMPLYAVMSGFAFGIGGVVLLLFAKLVD